MKINIKRKDVEWLKAYLQNDTSGKETAKQERARSRVFKALHTTASRKPREAPSCRYCDADIKEGGDGTCGSEDCITF